MYRTGTAGTVAKWIALTPSSWFCCFSSKNHKNLSPIVCVFCNFKTRQIVPIVHGLCFESASRIALRRIGSMLRILNLYSYWFLLFIRTNSFARWTNLHTYKFEENWETNYCLDIKLETVAMNIFFFRFEREEEFYGIRLHHHQWTLIVFYS